MPGIWASDATYYSWKSECGGMEASDVPRLKEMEDENRRLKQMFIALRRQYEALRDIVEKKLLDQPGDAS